MISIVLNIFVKFAERQEVGVEAFNKYAEL